MSASVFEKQVIQIASLGVWQVATGLPMVKRLETIQDPRWNKKNGLFVTLKNGLQVRGSVGMLESSTTLQESLFDAGQSAASHDQRFIPVQQDELPQLSIQVTLIEDVQKLQKTEDLKIGQHGLIISQGDKRAILLPNVAFEKNWTPEQFLEATCEKAQLPHSAWKDQNTLVEYFTCQVLESPRLIDEIQEFIDTKANAPVLH